MPYHRHTPRATLLALIAIAALAACGRPATPVDPATLPQGFSFQVENPDALSGAIFAPVYEAFGSNPGPMAAGPVAPAQASAIRDALDGAALALSGAVAGTLTPVAELSRINEVTGFFMGGTEVFFVPEGCDVTTVNPTEAAFATMSDLIVWDGSTLAANGLPAAPDGFLELSVVDGAVQTVHLLIASKHAWSAKSNGPCTITATAGYVLDLDVTVGWQFLRATFDDTVGAAVYTFESRSLADVAAAGVIGVAEPSGGVVLGHEAPRLTPIYR